MPISAKGFQYGTETCGLICSVDQGPFSPMRRGSANNIYVIPAPDKLTFNSATLLAAACCVPALLLLISNWNKIREINALEAKRLKEKTDADAEEDQGSMAPSDENDQGDTNVNQQPPPRPNSHDADDTEVLLCTCNDQDPANTGNRRTRNVVATPIFGAAILAILIIGEWNFFSTQVSYQTEPIASIGKATPDTTTLPHEESTPFGLCADPESLSRSMGTGRRNRPRHGRFGLRSSRQRHRTRKEGTRKAKTGEEAS